MASDTRLMFITRIGFAGRWPIVPERVPALGKGLGGVAFAPETLFLFRSVRS